MANDILTRPSIWDVSPHRAGLIYLASPYSLAGRSTHSERIQRFTEVCQIAGSLLDRGHLLFCPIAMSHAIEMETGPREPEHWQAADEPFLHRCDSLVVALLEGWQRSPGVGYEIGSFRGAKKPIFVAREEE